MPLGLEPIDVATATKTSADAFQAVIDAGADATADLQSQLDAVEAQIAPLIAQRNGLRKLLAEAESPEVKKAKQAKQLLEMLDSPAGFAQLRRFGL